MSPPNEPCSGRILLVDDNPLGLVARKAVLEGLGYRIATAAEGAQALGCLDEQKFDLIVTDYKMPRMNGVELIVRIRQTLPKVPVILISGYTEALGLNEANTGADAVIAKNANEVQHLVRAVSRLLKRPVPKKLAGSHRPKMKVRSQSA